MTKSKRQSSYDSDEYATDDEVPTLWQVVNPIPVEYETPECKPWIDMCAAVDKQGDFHPLLDFLKTLAPPEAIPFVQDLFERHNVKGFSGRSDRTPLYALSGKMKVLYLAKEEAKHLVSGGMKVDDAIKQVAQQYAKHFPRHKITEAAIKLAYKDRHRHLHEELKKVKSAR